MPAINALATFQPTCNTRTWLSTPHPHLPIIATACSDKTARIYSLQNFQQQSTISGGHSGSIRSCAWKPNSVGESVLATGSFDHDAGIWRRFEEGGGKGGAQADEIDFTKGLAGGDEAEDEDEDEEWKYAVVLEGHESEIKSLSFSPTSPLIATCSRDKTIWIWEELEDDNFETVAVLQDHEGDVKCVAWHPEEELLASASYDDTIRLWREDVDDWACCALLTGHGGTVWWVQFEASAGKDLLSKVESPTEQQKALLEERDKAGSRLMSCSEDQTIRVWRRIPKDNPAPTGQGAMPSIWKNSNFEETWIAEARLPKVHERSIYAVTWSPTTGRVASTGSDGKIVLYEERWASAKSGGEDAVMRDATPVPDGNALRNGEAAVKLGLTEWVILAEFENAHDVFEINHVCWAPRADREKRHDGEEVLISTGDDGEVKVWTIDP